MLSPDRLPLPGRTTARPWATWWTGSLAALAVALFGAALAEQVRCRVGGCTAVSTRLLGLDSIGGLPRLYTTLVFVLVAVVAGRGAARCAGPARSWWTVVAVIGFCLSVLKLLSVHSFAKSDAFGATLGVGLLVTVVVLTALRVSARRCGLPAGTPLVVALAVYAFAALGLDLVTSGVAAATASSGQLADYAATFVEELGEALAALGVLVTAWRHAPPA